MENENIYPIPLNSNIDTETSSQLVSAENPTLSYNPQEFQGEVLPNSLRYEHDGWAAGMYVHEFPDDGEYMKCHTTHVETAEEVDVARIKMSDEYTLCKQMWDSSMETEDYWYINPTHILQLTKHEFIIWHNLGTLHHWNANNWEVVSRVQRTAILTDKAFKWLCSSTADSSDVKFIVLEYIDDKSFRVTIYHSLTLFPAHVTSTVVTIEKRSLNSVLLNGPLTNLTSYHPIDCTNLISQSKISATSVSDYLLLGIAYNKGLSQWTLVFDSNGDVVRRVTGYGHVGIHGELTGGEIPSIWCDGNGVVPSFNVHDVDYLRNSACTNGYGTEIGGDFRSNSIVGTESQHWFIMKNIDSIVSHMTWNGSDFTPVHLTLNNNYSAKYVSPSCEGALMGDFAPIVKNILDIMPFFKSDEFIDTMLNFDPLSVLDDIPGLGAITSILLSPIRGPVRALLHSTFKEIITDIMFPSVYYICPKIGLLQHLQMSIGQYAYVWYNSTEHTLEKDSIKVSKAYSDMTPFEQKEYKEQAKAIKAVTDDQLSFDKQTFTQTADNSNPFGSNDSGGRSNMYGFFGTILLALAGSGLDVLEQRVERPIVNRILGHQSSGAMTDDRSFGQMFLDNVWNLMGSDTGYHGRMVCLTNTITALKTLDMFYSIGDNTQCYAGVGHVSHSMQAQCVAQSIVSTRDNGYLIGCLIPAKFLTLLELELRHRLWSWLAEVGQQHVEGIASSAHGEWTVAVGSVTDGEDPTSVRGAEATLRIIAWSIIQWTGIIMREFTEICLQNGEDMLGSLFPESRFIPYGKVDKNEFNIEGKHNYGTKSCTFMWPCFDCESNTYTNEGVDAIKENYACAIDLSPKSNARGNGDGTLFYPLIPPTASYGGTVTDTINLSYFNRIMKGELVSQVVKPKGWNSIVPLPTDMAVVEGCTSFLPTATFKNERIGVSSPVFGFPPIQDYILDKRWDLGMTCTAGSINAISVKDTKLIDGHFSNAYITDSFCGITSAYGAFEVKRGIQKDYLRPYAVTPNILATNTTGINAYSRNIAYHAFDGYSTRIVKWVGGAGMNKERRNFLYTFLADGNIKMSNNYPANVYFGYFRGAAPTQAIPARRGFTNYVYNSRDLEGMNSVVNNEYRAMERYSIPVFTELVGILPVVVRTYGSFVLKRFSGVTSLCTELRETDDGVYKMEAECDFAIRNNTYRVTPEYLNVTNILDSRTDVQAVWAKLGLQYIGSDQEHGYFYNQSTHQYYAFDGGTLRSVDIWNRFSSITTALYDFLSQDVAYRCDASYDELDISPYKADNELMINLFNQRGVHRNMYPPIETIMSAESDFLLRTFPSGVTYQGPNRCIINRSIWQDYMLEDVKRNKRKWLKLPRENFHPWRKYEGHYEQVNIPVQCDVKGWTHNPFVFVTSAIGLAEDVDCVYEWEVVFEWTREMDLIYEQNEYVCISLAAKTFAPGGILTQRPTHLFLTREHFSRNKVNCGYYSFFYRSNGGAGNKEQLFIWADGYIAISDIRLHVKNITSHRTTPLTIQCDVEKLIEI